MKDAGRVPGGFVLLCAVASVSFARPTGVEIAHVYGVHAVQESELRDSLRLVRGALIETGAVRDTLAAVARRMREFYYARGYYAFAIDSFTVDFAPDSSVARCAAYLREGKRTIVDSVVITGDSALGGKRIRSAMATQQGNVLDARVLAADIEALLVLYEDNGYPFAAIEVADVALDSARGLVVRLDIQQGASVVIADVTGKAKGETSPDVFRRASGIEFGKPYDQRRVDMVKQKLEHLQIFSSVGDPVLVMRAEHEGILRVPADEANTTLIDAIFGYVPAVALQSGYVTGSVDISFLNLFGSARKFGFHWQRLQQNSQDLWATYHEPWALGLPISADIRVEQQEQDTLYTRRSLQLNGAILFADHFTVTGSISLISTVPGSVDTTGQFPSSSENSAGVELSYDTRDNVYNPRSGVLYSSGYSAGVKSVAGVSGSAPIQTVDINTEAYYEFVPYNVAALAMHGGSVSSSALDISDMYRVGGVNSIRGYQDHQFYASRLLWGTAEYRIILSELSFISAFTDIGYYIQTATMTQPMQQQGSLVGYGVSIQTQSALGLLRVSFALGRGEPFNQAKIHIGVVNRF